MPNRLRRPRSQLETERRIVARAEVLIGVGGEVDEVLASFDARFVVDTSTDGLHSNVPPDNDLVIPPPCYSVPKYRHLIGLMAGLNTPPNLNEVEALCVRIVGPDEAVTLMEELGKDPRQHQRQDLYLRR